MSIRNILGYAALALACGQALAPRAEAGRHAARQRRRQLLQHAPDVGGDADSQRPVASELGASGFRIGDVHRKFVLPIAFHKTLNSAAFTAGLERALAHAGLTRLFGSPVTLVAERCTS